MTPAQAARSITSDPAYPIPFDNSYTRLPDAFCQRLNPAGASEPQLVRVNDALARQLRINPTFLKSERGLVPTFLVV
jgi:uncharacterized protein YdiU (UPF0061 family)